MTSPRSLIIAAMSSAGLLSACQQKDAGPANDVMAANEAIADSNAAAGNAMVAGATTAQLMDATGKAIGQVELAEDSTGLTIKLSAAGMPEGSHGLHLHEKGMCDGPKFESAGGHWNPMAKKHGKDNPMGAHLGDLANLDVPAGGAASASVTVAGVSMSGDGNKLADADGTSLVVHAKADDYKTDPSGDSGDRVACAVLAPPAG